MTRERALRSMFSRFLVTLLSTHADGNESTSEIRGPSPVTARACVVFCRTSRRHGPDTEPIASTKIPKIKNKNGPLKAVARKKDSVPPVGQRRWRSVSGRSMQSRVAPCRPRAGVTGCVDARETYPRARHPAAAAFFQTNEERRLQRCFDDASAVQPNVVKRKYLERGSPRSSPGCQQRGE